MVETCNEVRYWFQEATNLPLDSRFAFLQSNCLDDQVRREVLSLLEYDSDGAEIRVNATLEDVLKEAAQAVLSEGSTAPARRVGAFEIGRLLGSGGMGSVYEAHRVDGEVRQRVAVKFAGSGTTDSAMVRESMHRRFQQERQVLGALRHPYIAGLIDAGTTADGVPYAVIEQVDGIPIDSYCDRAVPAIEDRVRLVLKLCEAVQFAHGNLIVHRDIKPDNVLVTPDGIPKLIDFGVATGLEEDATMTMTRAFTPAYASPEQARGPAATVATDVYGIGSILYRLVTGAKPRELNGSASEVMRRISEEDVRRPSTLRPDLKGDLENILMKALQREPDRRYRSVLELADDLERYLARRPVRASPDSVLYRSRRFVRRHWVPLGATCALVGALAISTAVLAVERQNAMRRAAENRRLAATLLFDVHDEIGGLASGAKARAGLSAIAVRYLEGLERDHGADPEFAWELLSAYSRLGQSLGGGASSIGDVSTAVRLAKKTLQLGAIVENAGPAPDRLQKLFAAYEGLVPVFQQAHRPTEQREAIDRLLRLAPGLGPLRQAEALTHFARYLDDHASNREGSEAFERALSILRTLSGSASMPPGTAARLTTTLVGFGRAQALRGNFAGAVASLEEAIRLAERTVASDPQRITGIRQLHWSHIALGDVFGSPGRFSLGRISEAVAHYSKARTLADGLIRADGNNEVARLDAARAITRIAVAIAADQPAHALELLDQSRAVLGSLGEPVSPPKLDAQFTYLASSVEPLVRLGEFEKARLRLLEARRIASSMRQAGAEVEDRSLLKAEAILLYAQGRRSEALDRARMQLALLPSGTDPVLSANFETVDVLGRMRNYAAGIDAGACASATGRLVGIWDDLLAIYPHSRMVKTQRERALALQQSGCPGSPTIVRASSMN
jgi:tetratricopeptide (TPR) repeat protein